MRTAKSSLFVQTQLVTRSHVSPVSFLTHLESFTLMGITGNFGEFLICLVFSYFLFLHIFKRLWRAVGGTHLPTHLLVSSEKHHQSPHISLTGKVWYFFSAKNSDADITFIAWMYAFYLQDESNTQSWAVYLTLRHKPARQGWDSKGLENE